VHAGEDAATADGSAARPYATILEGVRRAGRGGWVLVAGGEYRERLVVPGGWTTHVVGACPARVTLRGTGALGVEGATVAVAGAGTGLDLQRVTVTGDAHGLQALDGATLRASGVVVAGCGGLGVAAGGEGANVSLIASVVRDTRGTGLDAWTGGAIRATRSVVAYSTEAEAYVGGAGAMAELDACVILGDPTRPTSSGRGISVERGASLVVRASVVQGCADVGVLATGAGVRVELDAVVVRGTHPRADGAGGAGLVVQRGAGLTATGASVVNNAEVGVAALHTGTRVELRASTIRGTRPRRDGRAGDGLGAQAGATLDVRAVRVENNARNGMQITGAGTRVTLSSSLVNGGGGIGHGVEVKSGAELRADGVLAVDNNGAAFYGVDRDTRLELEDCVARGTRGTGDKTGGALLVQDEANLRVTRALIADSAQIGVLVEGLGTRATLVDVVVRASGERGVYAGRGAALQAAGLLIADGRQVGLFAGGEGTRVELVRSVVRGIVPIVGLNRRSVGVSVEEMAALTATDMVIAENTDTGLFARDHSEVGLERCVIRDNQLNPSFQNRSYGVGAVTAARLRASRTLIADHLIGVVVDGDGSRVELANSIVRGAPVHPDDPQIRGRGVIVQPGAELYAERAVIEGTEEAGVVIGGQGARATLNASVIRAIRPNLGNTFGRGLSVQDGAQVTVAGLLVEGVYEAGVFASDEGTLVTARDLLIRDVRPNARSLGVGVFMMGGARLTQGERVAIRSVMGAGIIAVTQGGATATRADVRDLLVRGVRSSTVRFSEEGSTITPVGSTVAYGLHADALSAINATRAEISEGDYGLYNAGGLVCVRQGVIAAQRVSAGAVDLATPDAATTLSDVAFVHNARDTITRHSDLPTASSLPPPPPIQP
jgi:hypothetical protein